MRILILLITFLGLAQAFANNECTPIDKDFLSYYGAPKETPLIGLSISVSGNKKDKIVCSSESCGSGGCECALYIPTDGCMKRVLEFRGGHKVLGEKKDGISSIEIRKKGDAIAPALKKIFIWDKDRRHYVENVE